MKNFPITLYGKHSKLVAEDVKVAIAAYRHANPVSTAKHIKQSDIENVFAEFFNN